MADLSRQWFYKRGELARDGWESVVDDTTPGWEHTGIRVARLNDGTTLDLPGSGVEKVIVPLAGSAIVTYTEDGVEHTVELAGRSSVFDGTTDVLYLSSATTGTLAGSGRIAVATSPTDVVKPTRYIAAEETPIELRGAGASSRQVHNFGTVAALDAARLIVCEVITPSQNWSSYPPHKHDEEVPGREVPLEEIYYFEAAETRSARREPSDAAFGLFSTYSSPAGSIDIGAKVHSGDIAIVPFGYHGPAVAAPGYDLYYLNVMAGPSPERAWVVSDDPDHAWVRELWEGLEPDSRLPYVAD
ncbi:5-deoxy-glucuronate isomerase [Microbacterium protaetiae]|uniref:5-deoxy-glucuronate isomerase n=1 Tax=Microbacterium protaetiae TaxID=2509458 RepID=A0A4P6EHP8_9MICO|nr:5-deoxy-glucuronate isomerase [Microbacterium protaetiae]QAY59647.1 5-deoxy-glucuronate isomerase [Microbacterium protaetiae]